MHHPTDVIGSVVGALGCIAFALLATRTAVAVQHANEATTAGPGERDLPATPLPDVRVGS
jgi:membrane-associated phospholipid phosphatase